jgi:hypothetical protein
VYTPLARQQWKTFLCKRLEGFLIITPAGSNNEPEPPTFCEPLFKELVCVFLVAPMLIRWHPKIVWKFADFKRELAEGRRRDAQKSFTEGVFVEDGQLKKCHAESQSTKNRELCELEVLQLIVPYRRKLADRPAMVDERGESLVHTILVRYDGKFFKGMCTCLQYMRNTIPGKALGFDRSKIDPVWKLVGEVGPLKRGVITNKPETSA